MVNFLLVLAFMFLGVVPRVFAQEQISAEIVQQCKSMVKNSMQESLVTAKDRIRSAETSQRVLLRSRYNVSLEEFKYVLSETNKERGRLILQDFNLWVQFNSSVQSCINAL